MEVELKTDNIDERDLTLTLTSESLYGSQFFHGKLLRYLAVSKMKAICIPKFFNESMNQINESMNQPYLTKTFLNMFFYSLKLQNLEIVGLFIPLGV